MDIIKIIAVAIIGIELILLIKENNSEYSLLVEISILIVILVFLFGNVKDIIESVLNISDGYGIESGYIKIILKAVCISILVEIGSGICKDSGNSAIASKVELAGKVAILLLTIPLLEKITEFAVGLING